MRRKVLQHVTPGKVFIRSEIYSELCGVFPKIAVVFDKNLGFSAKVFCNVGRCIPEGRRSCCAPKGVHGKAVSAKKYCVALHP